MAEEFHGLFQFTEGDTNVKENDGGVDEDDDFLYTFERRKRHQIDRSWVPIDTVDQVRCTVRRRPVKVC